VKKAKGRRQKAKGKKVRSMEYGGR